MLTKSNLTVLAVAGALLAGSHFYAYQLGQHGSELDCAADREKAERQVADALAHLARRATEAEIEAEQRRAEARAVARQLRDSRDEKLAELPSSGCSVSDVRRLLFTSTYCARYPAAPACVQDPVSDLPNPAPYIGPGS